MESRLMTEVKEVRWSDMGTYNNSYTITIIILICRAPNLLKCLSPITICIFPSPNAISRKVNKQITTRGSKKLF